MSVTDPIADMFSAIKNALQRRDDFVYIQSSKLKERILDLLTREGYIEGWERLTGERLEEELKYYKELEKKGALKGKEYQLYKRLHEYNKGTQYPIKVKLKYIGPKKNKPAIQNLVKISKPGRRIYVPARLVPYVKRGLGTAIMSTDKGIITDKEARKLGVGGEVIGFVW
ncbi:MAG: 30S ribosomal protein S8 [Aquificae bacterium]|jgi:small subunit ribosomal protein S8|nr:30S ribosomal protein S8 [Aquificota bacterium]